MLRRRRAAQRNAVQHVATSAQVKEQDAAKPKFNLVEAMVDRITEVGAAIKNHSKARHTASHRRACCRAGPVAQRRNVLQSAAPGCTVLQLRFGPCRSKPTTFSASSPRAATRPFRR